MSDPYNWTSAIEKSTVIIDLHSCTNCGIPGKGLGLPNNLGKNSHWKYNFPQNTTFTRHSSISINSAVIPYSWFNISAAIGNNTISYTFLRWTRNIVIPDGFYELSQLNAYIQSIMIKCGDYLINPNGQYVYFADFTYNVQRYRLQFNSYSHAFGSTPLASWTIPSTWNQTYGDSYVTSISSGLSDSHCPLYADMTGSSGTFYGAWFIIPSKLFTYFGLRSSHPGVLPVGDRLSTTSTLSDFPSDQCDVRSILVHCKQIFNVTSACKECIVGSSDVLCCIQIQTTFGNDIVQVNIPDVDIPLTAGSYPSLDFYITDQEGNELFLEDPTVIMEFTLNRIFVGVQN